MKTAHLVFGNQLLHNHPAITHSTAEDIIIMIEAQDYSHRFGHCGHELARGTFWVQVKRRDN